MAWNTDRIMSVSALLVGVGSLFVVVYQTQLTREAQYASVRPYLYISLMSNDQGAFVILSNTGLEEARRNTHVVARFLASQNSNPQQHAAAGN